MQIRVNSVEYLEKWREETTEPEISEVTPMVHRGS